jgi:hypothetical protein
MVSYRNKEIRKLPGLVCGEEAAITVYFLLAGSALIIFFLALFNFGRYLTAKQQAALALEASASSILSYYQTDLAREMGLFALDTQDEGLQALGKAYFTANLGETGAINSQKCLIYALSFPKESRLNQGEIVNIQATDGQRIEGWLSLGQDLLGFLGITDWQSLLGIWAEPGLTGEASEDDLAGQETRLQREQEQKIAESLETDGGAGVKIWHFLLPWPTGGGFADVDMPEEIRKSQESADGEKQKQLEELAAFCWEILVSSKASKDEAGSEETEPGGADQEGADQEGAEPGEAVAGAADSWPGAAEALKNFLTDFQQSLSEALEKGKNKMLVTEYLLQELDYATNKPVLERYFSRCEAEYVRWGFANSWDNLRYTALQLFLLRSGLHLLKSVTSGEIADEITLAKAVLEAVVKGGAEVEKLFAGQRIPAFPGQSRLMMSYKDHLRLFLLCQKGEEQNRALQRLIQMNLWYWSAKEADGKEADGKEGAGAGGVAEGEAAFTLSRYATEIKVIAESKLSLWPFGVTLIRREGVMGYDRSFTLVS